MDTLCSDLMENPSVKCAYLAVVLILVLLIFMHVSKMGWFYEYLTDWEAGTPKYVEFRTGHGYVRNVTPRAGVVGGSASGLQTTSDTSRIPQEFGYIERS